MQKIIEVVTDAKEKLYDITPLVTAVVQAAAVESGVVSIYVRGATAAIMIQENWDDSVQLDVVSLLKKLIPHGVWQHDAQDNNGDAHLKAGIVGPSETVPIMGGKMGLSTWQNIFLCEFDGPRQVREVVVTVISD
ncbi:MAG: secondary thiamine-phosphate synthase enzyme YjbQ [Victivallaceae bacterium]|nr:secondary thiamine-phosphate synthase enzyme YjbQ [Victivallaceae bacterium]